MEEIRGRQKEYLLLAGFFPDRRQLRQELVVGLRGIGRGMSWQRLTSGRLREMEPAFVMRQCRLSGNAQERG